MNSALAKMLFERHTKVAFVPAQEQAAGPGGAPVDPAAMDPAAGGMPPGAMDPAIDPAAAGGMPPGAMDPAAAMPTEAPADPAADPAAMDPGAMPPEALPPEALPNDPAADVDNDGKPDTMVPLAGMKDFAVGLIEAMKGRRTAEAESKAEAAAEPAPAGGPISGMPMTPTADIKGPLKLAHVLKRQPKTAADILKQRTKTAADIIKLAFSAPTNNAKSITGPSPTPVTAAGGDTTYTTKSIAPKGISYKSPQA